MTRMNPDLAWYQTQFRANRRAAAAICDGLSGEQFNCRPAPKSWSIAECIAHLNLGGRAYIEQVNIAIDRGRARSQLAKGPQRYGWFTRWMIRAMEPPPRRKYKTPRRFVEQAAVFDIDAELHEFTAVGEAWEQCLDAANGLHLGRVKVRSPAMKLLRFPLGGLFATMAPHERRHLWQAQQVSRMATFVPSSEQK
jgi:hypothetical protein